MALPNIPNDLTTNIYIIIDGTPHKCVKSVIESYVSKVVYKLYINKNLYYYFYLNDRGDITNVKYKDTRNTSTPIIAPCMKVFTKYTYDEETDTLTFTP